jgi:transposase-like protein
MAARKNLPSVRIQTCFNHFKENIRRNLKVRSDDTYKPFMNQLEALFKIKLANDVMDKKLFKLYQEYQHDPVAVSVLTNIGRYKQELTAYRGIPRSPVTSNIIEGLNAHLEARLNSLRSFQSSHYAKLWLNGYVLKRRYTKFTDYRGKFKHINGKTGVEMTKKSDADLPILF